MELGAATRGRLARNWAYRTRIEEAASRRFARLAQRMAAVGAHGALVQVASKAEEEERLHVRLCGEIAERMSGQPLVLQPEPLHEVAPPSLSDPGDRVLYEIVAFCCITESANASLVTAGYDAISDRAIKQAARRILADEVRHSRLGWAYLSAHPPTATQAAWLGRDLPAMLAGAVRAELFADHPLLGDEETLLRHGSLPFARRREAFEACLHEVAFPGLEAQGVDTTPARTWLAEMQGPVP